MLKSLSAGALGIGLPEWLALEARAQPATESPHGEGRAKQVLVVYEEGGISQMDSFDPKPEALSDHRSLFAPITTTVPGTHFPSLMPMMAKQAHRISPGPTATPERSAASWGSVARSDSNSRGEIAVSLCDGGKSISELF